MLKSAPTAAIALILGSSHILAQQPPGCLNEIQEQVLVKCGPSDQSLEIQFLLISLAPAICFGPSPVSLEILDSLAHFALGAVDESCKGEILEEFEALGQKLIDNPDPLPPIPEDPCEVQIRRRKADGTILPVAAEPIVVKTRRADEIIRLVAVSKQEGRFAWTFQEYDALGSEAYRDADLRSFRTLENGRQASVSLRGLNRTLFLERRQSADERGSTSPSEALTFRAKVIMTTEKGFRCSDFVTIGWLPVHLQK